MRGGKEFVWSWNQYYGDSMAFAKSLAYLGVDAKKSVNIMGFNSPEWLIAFMGAVLNNNVASGVYATNGPEACFYQSENSEAQVIVVDTLDQMKIYQSIIDKLPSVRAVIAWGIQSLPEELSKDFRFYTFKNFIKLGVDIPTKSIQTKMAK